jgi:hypothetical protein
MRSGWVLTIAAGVMLAAAAGLDCAASGGCPPNDPICNSAAGSSSSSGTGSGGNSSGSVEPPCVAAGTPNNAAGYGGFCASANDCPAVDGAAHQCSAAKFCTGSCTSSEECGPGLGCVVDTTGGSCVPCVCLVAAEGELVVGGGCPSSDGGSDGGTDGAPVDATDEGG